MIDQLLALYHSAAYVPLVILLIYYGLTWGSTHVAWLEVPNRAHWIAIVLGGLALLVPVAQSGTTPNASQLIGAAVAALMLAAPGLAKSTRTAPPQGGFATGWLMGYVAVFGIVIASGCLSSAQKTAAKTALETCGVSQSPSVIGQLEQAYASDDWQGAITSNATLATLTTDALTCLTQTIVAVIEARSTTGSASVASLVPDPVLVHARQWLAAHGGGS